MTMRAHMQTNSATGVDAHNQPLPPDWVNVATPTPCKAWSTSRTEVVDGDKVATIEEIKAILPLSILGQPFEQMRVRQITDRADGLLFSGPLHVRTVQRKTNHVLVALRES